MKNQKPLQRPLQRISKWCESRKLKCSVNEFEESGYVISMPLLNVEDAVDLVIIAEEEKVGHAHVIEGNRTLLYIGEDQLKFSTNKMARKQGMYRSSFGPSHSYGGACSRKKSKSTP